MDRGEKNGPPTGEPVRESVRGDQRDRHVVARHPAGYVARPDEIRAQLLAADARSGLDSGTVRGRRAAPLLPSVNRLGGGAAQAGQLGRTAKGVNCSGKGVFHAPIVSTTFSPVNTPFIAADERSR
jgi:hypothetical protein